MDRRMERDTGSMGGGYDAAFPSLGATVVPKQRRDKQVPPRLLDQCLDLLHLSFGIVTFSNFMLESFSGN
jgi:hypothetical protein